MNQQEYKSAIRAILEQVIRVARASRDCYPRSEVDGLYASVVSAMGPFKKSNKGTSFRDYTTRKSVYNITSKSLFIEYSPIRCSCGNKVKTSINQVKDANATLDCPSISCGYCGLSAGAFYPGEFQECIDGWKEAVMGSFQDLIDGED